MSAVTLLFVAAGLRGRTFFDPLENFSIHCCPLPAVIIPSVNFPGQSCGSKFRRTIPLPCVIALAVLVLAMVGCASWQRKMFYFPPVFDPAKTDELGAAAKLERWKNVEGQTIGWKRPSPILPSRGQVLVLHGNAGCAVWSAHYADVLQHVTALDVFIVEYPGYADRPGKPTERMLEAAADEALNHLNSIKPVYLVGESLGTGVAAYLAGKHPDRIAGVALLAPYSSLTEVARAHVRVLPVGLILCDRFPAAEYLKSYRGPIAFVVANRDKVVPARFGMGLHQNYEGPKSLREIPDGDHGSVMTLPPEAWKEIVDFWRTHSSPHPRQ